MTVASSSAEVETDKGRPFHPQLRKSPGRFTSDQDRNLAKSILGQEPLEEDDVAKNIRREHGGDPIGGQVHRPLAADYTSVHDQRVDGSVDGRKAGADRTQISDVHENDVEYVPAGRGFEFGLCRCRSILVPARQVDPPNLGT